MILWVIRKDLSWVVKSQDLPWEITFFKKVTISFGLFFDENNIAKLRIHHAVSEEISAADDQLLLN